MTVKEGLYFHRILTFVIITINGSNINVNSIPFFNFSHNILDALCRSFFCPAFSDQIEQFLLPAMAYNKFPFPLVELIQTLLQQTANKSKTNQKTDKTDIPNTQWLLTAVVTFAERYLGILLN